MIRFGSIQKIERNYVSIKLNSKIINNNSKIINFLRIPFPEEKKQL